MRPSKFTVDNKRFNKKRIYLTRGWYDLTTLKDIVIGLVKLRPYSDYDYITDAILSNIEKKEKEDE